MLRGHTGYQMSVFSILTAPSVSYPYLQIIKCPYLFLTDCSVKYGRNGLNDKKRLTTRAEIFGAYGWMKQTSKMLYVAVMITECLYSMVVKFIVIFIHDYYTLRAHFS